MKPPPPKVHPLRILVVEDHAETLFALAAHLRKMGHTPVTAETAAAALQALADQEFDVLLCDIELPDDTGWTLIKAAPPDIFGIAVSGHNGAAERRRSVDAGFRAHVGKPFDVWEITPLLAEASLERKGG